jgi:hypothetical protein
MSKKLTVEEEARLERQRKSLLDEIKRCEKGIEIAKAMQELAQNELFKQVFDEFLFKDEAIRHTMLLTEKPLLNEQERMSLQDSLVGISFMRSWVESVQSLDVIYANQIEQSNQTLDKLAELQRG